MSLTEQKTVRVVVYEGEGAQPMSGETRFDAVRSLVEGGYAVSRVGERGGDLARADDRPALILGRFGGQQLELTGNGSEMETAEVEGLDGAGMVAAVEKFQQRTGAVAPGEWKPWFPVIDYDRCTNCMQCLSFCLFGVYGVDKEQQIQVQNNDNCKTNCPACSRVCPEAAIMFPKYRSGPINGAPVSDEDLQREKMKVDISALLGGDIYSMLRQRSDRAKSRFSKERSSDKALQERQKCLVKLQQAGDIPPEVLMSLPSPDEIQQRAEAAKAKADAALAGQKPTRQD